MYKNQLQELAQRSCFNLPSYACIREGPDHAPRFKASVNFNGEIFESPAYCTTLRQAEHAAAEAALNALSTRGPSRSLTARVLDETGVYKNLLQETAHRAGLNLPVYTTVRSGPGHVPVFTSRVDLAGMTFTGEPAKTKKQAEKNAAIAAWSALKTSVPNLGLWSQTSKDTENGKHQDQVIMARLLCKNNGSKDEERAIGGHQNHCRRRMARNHRDNGSNDHIVLQKQLRLIDLFADSTSEGSIEKQNSFVSLLPPPPPRTSSRILPQTSSRDCEFPCQTAARPNQIQVKGKEIAASPLDDLRRDEDEWLHGKSEVIKKTIEIEEDPDPSKSKSRAVHRGSPAYRLFELPNNEKVMNITLPLQHQTQDNAETQMRTGPHGPKTASKMRVSAIKASTCNHMVMRSPFSSGYHYHPQKIAPAVQVRSVIPVCAAPPPPVTTYLSNSPLIKEVVASPSDTTTQTAAEVLPSSHPKFNSPQFYSTFNKLHLRKK